MDRRARVHAVKPFLRRGSLKFLKHRDFLQRFDRFYLLIGHQDREAFVETNSKNGDCFPLGCDVKAPYTENVWVAH
eukprot:3450860-Rhodomonas_salina.2